MDNSVLQLRSYCILTVYIGDMFRKGESLENHIEWTSHTGNEKALNSLEKDIDMMRLL